MRVSMPATNAINTTAYHFVTTITIAIVIILILFLAYSVNTFITSWTVIEILMDISYTFFYGTNSSYITI